MSNNFLYKIFVGISLSVFLFMPTNACLTVDTELLNEIETFKPNDMIRIPGLEFTDVIDSVDSEGYLNIPWVGEYIKAVYNWGMVVVSIVAVIMIILTATKIIMGGGGATAEGYKKIGKIIIGLFLVWGSYVILYNINPALVQFKPLRVFYIIPEELSADTGDYEPSADELASHGPVSTDPVSGDMEGVTHPGEIIIGKCHVIPVESFPDFDVNTFGDSYNGRCLLQEFIPDTKILNKNKYPFQKQTTFLGRNIWINEKLVPTMQKISNEIIQKAQIFPIVQTWVDNFTTEGAFVPAIPIDLEKECNKPDKEETWVVARPDPKAKYYKYRLLTNLLKNLHGQKKVIMGDMHSMGLAIDVYAGSNWNDKPLYTQVPSPVVDAFYNNGFSWLGATAGRDAMHFQFLGNKCFKSLGKKYPEGLGCCMYKWGIKGKKLIKEKTHPELFVYPIPIYNDCVGYKPVPYVMCLGPGGVPGSMWVRQPQTDENDKMYITQ